ncbi:MAG TPA: isochorismatase family protein [Burkholderiales bacterium]|nr:isochorismatase family protein [Burkholderiales bacterium]
MSSTDIYRQQNFGNRLGFGAKSALVVVDFTVGFNDPALFGGGNIDAAIRRSVGLLQFFRRAALPIAFTRVVYAEDGSNAGMFCRKAPNLRLLTETHPAGQIVPELAPRAGELVVRKTEPSAFFGTGLAAWLVQQRADTVVVAGCTTSGCVRASVVDAMSYNFRPIVARDCVGDRAPGPHEANLFDMAQKYADILERDEIMSTLEPR